MKAASPQLISLLRSNTRLPHADCFTLTTNYGADIGELSVAAGVNPAGLTFFYTNLDVDVQVGNILYLSSGVRIKGIRYKLTRGLEVDEQTITIYATDEDKIGASTFIQSVASGLLDGARFRQDRAFFDPDVWPPKPADPCKAAGAVNLFVGSVTSIEEIGRTAIAAKVKSDLSLLDIDMPRNLYQPSCLHTLYDEGCGLKKALFQSSGSAAAGSTVAKINWSNSKGADYFAQGTMKMTSGLNNGQSRPVRGSDGTGFTLLYPLQYAPATGDTFVIYPGCDHTFDTCKNKFMNERNFRGFPYVPPPETAV